MKSNTFLPDERDYEMVAAMVMGFGSDANAARRADADLLIQLRDRVRACMLRGSQCKAMHAWLHISIALH